MSLSSLFYEPLDPKDAPPAAKALYEHVKDKPLHNDAILEAIPQFYSGWKRRSFVQLLDYLTQMGYTHTLTPEDCLQAQIQKKQLVRFGPFWYQPGDLVSEMKARLKVYAIAAPIVILLAYLFAALNG